MGPRFREDDEGVTRWVITTLCSHILLRPTVNTADNDAV